MWMTESYVTFPMLQVYMILVSEIFLSFGFWSKHFPKVLIFVSTINMLLLSDDEPCHSSNVIA